MQKTKFLFLLLFTACLGAEEKPCVTCHFAGRLGNQMFEIAHTIAYALDHNCEPRFPHIEEAEQGPLYWKYFFHRLNVSPFSERFPLKIYHQDQITDYFLYASIPYEPDHHICLHGFYQNERYFAHHKKTIQELFAPTEEIEHLIQQKYHALLQRPTVAIHVRTFIPDGRTPYFQRNYYLRALDQFSDEFTFLIFSDCPSWTRQAFPQTHKNLVFIEEESLPVAFYLMTACQHQVISPESTFSWWAAWLNPHPEKKVLAPDHWHGYRGEDAFPPDWIRISTD